LILSITIATSFCLELELWRNKVNRLPSDYLDYGVLTGKPCKYGMYPMDRRKDKWFLTSEGHVSVERYRVYDQNKYCMDTFHNKLELNHSFYLFICAKRYPKDLV